MKKTVAVLISLTLASVILTAVLLEAFVFSPHEQAIPVKEILLNPDLYVNKTVSVKGIIESVVLPSPTQYGLFPEHQTDFLYLNWTSNLNFIQGYNATSAIVFGVIKQEKFVWPYDMSSNKTQIQIYVIDAAKVELLTYS